MSETAAAGPETELSPLQKIDAYLEVLRGVDVAAYEQADGMLDEVWPLTPATKDHGVDLDFSDYWTSLAVTWLKDLHENPTHNNLTQSRKSRTAAVVRIVPSMVDGLRIPISDFGPIIGKVVSTINHINEFSTDDPPNEMLRSEILHRLPVLGDTAVPSLRRIAEAYKWVDHPKLRMYGKLAVRAARAERKVSDQLHVYPHS